MEITPSQDDINEIKEIWQWIRWWKDKFNFTSAELASRAKYSQDRITRGISGEPVPIRHALRNFVEAFGLDLEGRGAKSYEDMLSDDEYKKFLKPPRELTPSEKLYYLEKF